MEYGTKWVFASYPKETMAGQYVVTSLKYIMKKGNYNVFECDNGRQVNVFSDQINILQVLRENPNDLYAVGYLLPNSNYYSYSIETDLGMVNLLTVCRIMPIMAGCECTPRRIVIPNGQSWLPIGY